MSRSHQEFFIALWLIAAAFVAARDGGLPGNVRRRKALLTQAGGVPDRRAPRLGAAGDAGR
jgi:hypothetical protein